MIQIDINSRAPVERFTSKSGPAATTSLSAEPRREEEAEPDPADASADTTYFVSPPPAPWPRVLPGI